MTEPTADELAGAAWRRIRSLVLEQHDRRGEASAAVDLSFIRIKTLHAASAGSLTMSELAERLHTDRPYMTLVVDDLEQRGLVRRDLHPDDRRQKVVSVTPAGVKAASLADPILSRPPESLAGLPLADLAELNRILRSLPD